VTTKVVDEPGDMGFIIVVEEHGDVGIEEGDSGRLQIPIRLKKMQHRYRVQTGSLTRQKMYTHS
jgi:hypothetical protein